MKHLNTSRKMSRVFRGSVLALALLLVACGGDADEPTPTATSGLEQAALPTVDVMESTPAADVSEEEITMLEPEVPATSEASTPDEADDVATPAEIEDKVPPATPDDGPIDLTQSDEDDEVDVASTPNEDVDPSVGSTPASVDETAVDESTPMETNNEQTVDIATPPADEDATATAVEAEHGDQSTPESDEEEASNQPTERPRTGEETFDNPGDGTGGSGMPGENNVNVLDGDGEESPIATPAASPIAQLEITGCEVPDVPGFLGDTSTFILTIDVNFRSGPGVDCDPLMEEPLGVGQTVEVTGGPVTQTEDDSEWVQIEIDGQPGWITTEFIEPVE